jgi:hypothetical protein
MTGESAAMETSGRSMKTGREMCATGKMTTAGEMRPTAYMATGMTAGKAMAAAA